MCLGRPEHHLNYTARLVWQFVKGCFDIVLLLLNANPYDFNSSSILDSSFTTCMQKRQSFLSKFSITQWIIDVQAVIWGVMHSFNHHQSLSLKCDWTMWALLTPLDRDQCSCTLLPFNSLSVSVLVESDFRLSICCLEWECTRLSDESDKNKMKLKGWKTCRVNFPPQPFEWCWKPERKTMSHHWIWLTAIQTETARIITLTATQTHIIHHKIYSPVWYKSWWLWNKKYPTGGLRRTHNKVTVQARNAENFKSTREVK